MNFPLISSAQISSELYCKKAIMATLHKNNVHLALDSFSKKGLNQMAMK